ncbi:MAG TPA: LysM domain-containing protein, partial [Candidatus Limnocylindrales bacterium]|nr:LysM domain-containing protein [Candidatus Limnocylindrales bacterium]
MGPDRQVARRTLTPAVMASALFVVVCAGIAVTFVAARGGLQLPVAPGNSQAAVGSPGPSTSPTIDPAATAPPSGPIATPSATLPQTEPPTGPSPSPVPSPAATPAGTADPLAALPGCPGIAGCYEYEIQRGDSLSGVASRYAIPVWVVLALNPEVS